MDKIYAVIYVDRRIAVFFWFLASSVRAVSDLRPVNVGLFYAYKKGSLLRTQVFDCGHGYAQEEYSPKREESVRAMKAGAVVYDYIKVLSFLWSPALAEINKVIILSYLCISLTMSCAGTYTESIGRCKI